MATKRKKYPSQARLRELFDYDPEGFLVWRWRDDVRKAVNTRFAGERAGCRGVGTVEHENGFKKYAEIRVNGKTYRQHELVWIWHKGDIPSGKVVSHISGEVLVSKIEKLIILDNKNSKPWQRNARFLDGIVGVNERKGKVRTTYQAIASDGSHLGTFSTKDAAAAAYNEYAKDRWGDEAILNDVDCDDFEKYRLDSRHGGQAKKRDNGRMLGCYFDERKGSWYSRIGEKYLGSFYTEEQCARAYNIAAHNYYGDQAILNDIPRPLSREPIFRNKGDIVGVQRKGKRYTAVYNGKSLGTYDTEDEAARKYNIEALRVEGEQCHANNIEDPFLDPGQTVIPPKGGTGLRGVYAAGTRYAARFKKTNLGRFDTKEEAARAYNRAARDHYGEHAVLNDVPDPFGDGDVF